MTTTQRPPRRSRRSRRFGSARARHCDPHLPTPANSRDRADAGRIAAELHSIATARGAGQTRLVAMSDRMRNALESANPGAGRIGWWVDLNGLPAFTEASSAAVLIAALAELPDPRAAVLLASPAELDRYGHRLGDLAELAEVLLIRAAPAAVRRGRGE